MKELGVTPAKVSTGLSSLMGTYAMFGEAASANIAKAVFAAEKMRIDPGTLTALANSLQTLLEQLGQRQELMLFLE